MEEPKMTDKKPAVVELEPGNYSWCACGLTSTQPFCDGAHRERSSLKSVPFTVTEKKRVALCQCRKTGNQPFCDGSHTRL